MFTFAVWPKDKKKVGKLRKALFHYVKRPIVLKEGKTTKYWGSFGKKFPEPLKEIRAPGLYPRTTKFEIFVRNFLFHAKPEMLHRFQYKCYHEWPEHLADLGFWCFVFFTVFGMYEGLYEPHYGMFVGFRDLAFWQRWPAWVDYWTYQNFHFLWAWIIYQFIYTIINWMIVPFADYILYLFAAVLATTLAVDLFRRSTFLMMYEKNNWTKFTKSFYSYLPEKEDMDFKGDHGYAYRGKKIPNKRFTRKNLLVVMDDVGDQQTGFLITYLFMGFHHGYFTFLVVMYWFLVRLAYAEYDWNSVFDRQIMVKWRKQKRREDQEARKDWWNNSDDDAKWSDWRPIHRSWRWRDYELEGLPEDWPKLPLTHSIWPILSQFAGPFILIYWFTHMTNHQWAAVLRMGRHTDLINFAAFDSWLPFFICDCFLYWEETNVSHMRSHLFESSWNMEKIRRVQNSPEAAAYKRIYVGDYQRHRTDFLPWYLSHYDHAEDYTMYEPRKKHISATYHYKGAGWDEEEEWVGLPSDVWHWNYAPGTHQSHWYAVQGTPEKHNLLHKHSYWVRTHWHKGQTYKANYYYQKRFNHYFNSIDLWARFRAFNSHHKHTFYKRMLTWGDNNLAHDWNIGRYQPYPHRLWQTTFVENTWEALFNERPKRSTNIESAVFGKKKMTSIHAVFWWY